MNSSAIAVGGLDTLERHATPNAKHLHAELPYRFYDPFTGIYENSDSFGIAKKLTILGGASDELTKSLNTMLCGFPEGRKWEYNLVMIGNNQVSHIIDRNTENVSARGGVVAELAKNQAIYAHHAVKHGFNTNFKGSKFDLKNYESYLFCTSKDNKASVEDFNAVVESSFIQAGIHHEPMLPVDLIEHVGQLLNFDKSQTRPRPKSYNPDDYLNTQMVEIDSQFLIHKKYVESKCTFAGQKEPAHTRMAHFTLRQTPTEFRLYNFPNVIASVKNIGTSLRCPFKISVNFQIENSGVEKVSNDKKIQELTKWATSKMSVLMPTLTKEYHERKDMQMGQINNDFKMATFTFNLTLFSDEENFVRDCSAAESVFGLAGLEMVTCDMLQGQALLASLPFNALPFWGDLKKAGRLKKVKTSNVVNFLPIVGEFKRYSGGLLLPTMRNQISYFHPFRCDTDNYNMAITGGSGGGKSFLMQCIANVVFGEGGKVFILDKGDSYKKLTQTMGGSYMTAGEIYLNPFTHLGKVESKAGRALGDIDTTNLNNGDEDDPIRLVLEDITGLFAVMASPNEELSGVQFSGIMDAILAAWTVHRNETLVDHVQAELLAIAAARGDDRRLSDIAYQLNQYCTTGINGEIFNKASQLDPSIHLTTVELEGFGDNVLRPVIFALMTTINQIMYLSGDRSTPKLCIIEEAWSLMSGSNRQSKAFINKGYRTARKFGGSFASVVQNLLDYFISEEAQAAYNNSDIKIILRQGDGFEDFVTKFPNAFNKYHIQLIRDFKVAKQTGFSSVMIKAGTMTTFHRLFADANSRAMLSTEPSEYEYCEKLTEQGHTLKEAINKTAWHFYPKEMDEFEHIKAQYYQEQAPCSE